MLHFVVLLQAKFTSPIHDIMVTYIVYILNALIQAIVELVGMELHHLKFHQ